MNEFTTIPDYVINESPEFDTLTSEKDIGIEQRRPRREVSLRKWSLQFKNRTLAEYTTIKNFYTARLGSFEAFEWENPLDSTRYIVRFEDDSLTFKCKNFGVFDISIKFKEERYWSTTSSTSTTSTSTSTTSTSTTSTSTTSTSTTSMTSTSTTTISTTSTTSTSTTSTTSTSTTTTT